MDKSTLIVNEKIMDNNAVVHYVYAKLVIH